MEQRIQCTVCNCVKYKRSKEQHLFVAIPVEPSAEKGTPVDLAACLEATFAEELVDDFYCSKCEKNCSVKSRRRFITYPTCLAFVLKRLVYADWVPKKLEIELIFDRDSAVDLTCFRGNNCEL